MKGERERTPPKKETVLAEPDQIERIDVMFARQLLDVVPPPVRGATESVKQDERRSASSFANPE